MPKKLPPETGSVVLKRPRGRPKKAQPVQLPLEFEVSVAKQTDEVLAREIATDEVSAPVDGELIFVRAVGAWVKLYSHKGGPPVSPNIITCHKSCPYDCRVARSLKSGGSDADIEIKLAPGGNFESTQCPVLSRVGLEVRMRLEDMRKKYSFDGWIEIGFEKGPPLARVTYTIWGDFADDKADEIWRYVLAGISAAVNQR